MITINNKKYKVYDLDTVETFKNRLASNFNTLSQFLIFNPELDENFKEKKEFNMKNILSIILKEENVEIFPFFNEYEKYFTDFLDIVKLWLTFNPNLEKDEKIVKFVTIQSVKEIYPDFDVDKFLNYEKKDYRDFIKNKILKNKKESEELLIIFKNFDKINPVNYTEFTTDSISIIATLNISNISLLEIFNSIILNPTVPIASLKDFFKIYKNFKPKLAWSVSDDNIIILKVSRNSDNEIAPFNKYSDVFILLDNNKIILSLDFSFKKDKISQNFLINRVLNIFSGFPNKKVISTSSEKIKGVYYYPFQDINKYIFADLVMNDPLFSIFLSIDESVKAVKSKSSVYIHFSDPQNLNMNISAILTSKIMSRERTKNLDPDLFPINEPYLRIRISNAKNMESVNNFIFVFSKLLRIYNNNFENMINFYKEYIPNFGTEVEKLENIKKSRIKDIAPEVFVSLYSKKCNYKPEIVDKKTALSKPEGEKILFPATSKEGKQRYYICPHDDKKYPGLFVNTLDNRDKFPFLPCCYTKNRSQTKGSNFRKYFYGEENLEKEQQTILITNKTATSSGFGALPPLLNQMFKLIDLTPSVNYYRKGTSKNPSNFLECVLEALYEQTGFLSVKMNKILTDTTRIKRTEKFRKEIANWKFLSVGRQELYDLTFKEIQEELKNTEVYLQPKKYIRIFEAYFNCNIFIFSRDNKLGKMELPRFSQAYLKYKLKNQPTILIYEHWGNKTENLKYPQCELIVRWDKVKESPDYIFSPDDEIPNKLDLIESELSLTYNFSKVEPFFTPNINKLQLISQVIDSYGKVRIINIKYENELYPLITEPIPPLKLPENQIFNFNEWPIIKVKKFIKETQSSIISQNVINGILKELQIKYGNISIILPIKDSTPLKDIPFSYNKKIISHNQYSSFLEYNYLKKTARYLSEYFIYYFSIYISKMKIIEIKNFTSKIIENFVKDKIVKISNYNYKLIDRNFNINSNIFKDGKLVITSQEILKRLIYVLNLRLTQNFSKVINYKNKISIENYYIDITDFDFHPDQTILQGEDSLEKWIVDQESLNTIHDSVISRKDPYFFKNEKIDDKIYLAQNTPKFDIGINIGKNWENKGYNSITAKDESNLACTLYSYQNKNLIEPYKVSGIKNSYDLKILGYKQNDINNFTILMPLQY